MKFIKVIKIFLLTLLFVSFSPKIYSASIDGTTNISYVNYHYPFANSDTAEGFVRLTSGFTIPSGAEVTIGIHPPVSGAIELKDLGKIKLNKDIYLDSTATLSNGGYIDGQGNSIILGGDLTIPAGKNLTITGDTIINGNNFNLILENISQLIIDANTTLTLKNITLKNTYNDETFPQIVFDSSTSKLALNNFKFSFQNDFIFKTGQMYFDNDVVFTGTSKFSYESDNTSFIQPHSTLYFDKNTTFNYAPNSINNDLIVLTDETSSIYLDGCTLQITNTGIKLTKGQLFFDNKVTLTFNPQIYLTLTSIANKNLSDVSSVAWSPNGNYLAVAEYGPFFPGNIYVYSWNGSTLSQLDTKALGDNRTITWSPNGNYLAVVGDNDPNDIIIYSWNGSALTQLDTKNFGTVAISASWTPDGNYLTVGGNNGTTDLIHYSWNGSTLSTSGFKSFGAGVTSVAWSSNGNYLAVGGDNGSTDLIIYNSSLTQLDSKDLGSGINVAWSTNDNYLAVGSKDTATNLGTIIIYSWNGSSLNQLYTQTFGTIAPRVAWSHNDNYLAIGGYNGTTSFAIYEWDGTYLNQILTKNTVSVSSIDWNLVDSYIAVGTSGNNDVIVYENSHLIEIDQTFYNSIRFGDSSLGSEYNLNTYLLSGAQVDINGLVWIDDAE